MLLAVLLLAVTRAALAVDEDQDSKTPVVSGRRGSCRASGLCCQSKNNTCRGALDDDEDRNVVEKQQQFVTRCFCDAACLNIGDCCDDYATACQRQ